ncbi:hypothetical protein EDB86DRAFT_3082863 [Lactarius hatsudake]|nr:hypothetical protein EDB86DRAFT_3082863 [Lactarius hatsudake]
MRRGESRPSANASPTTITLALEPLFAFLSDGVIQAESVFYRITGSHVIARSVGSSHQNDPIRTDLEILALFLFIRTRTHADNGEKHFIQFLEKSKIDELVDEWTPDPLGAPLIPAAQSNLVPVPVVSGANEPQAETRQYGQARS